MKRETVNRVMRTWMWVNVALVVAVLPVTLFAPRAGTVMFFAAGVSTGIRMLKEKR